MGSTTHLTREQRLAEAKARRQGWQPDTTPRCTVAGCHRHADRADRCPQHWAPLRQLVGTMAGEQGTVKASRRAFSEAMATTAMSPERWADGQEYAEAGAWMVLAELLDEATDALYAAGWYVGQGPRGGLRLARRVAQ